MNTPTWGSPQAWGFVGGVLVLLAIATAIGQYLKRQPEAGLNPALIQVFNRRIRAWWLLCSLVAAAFLFHEVVTVVLFGLISFWALREYITLTPTRLGDHRALFWVFVFFTPAQFVLVGMGQDMYALYSVLIPLYGTLFIPARVAFSGDHENFLERTAKIQAGLIVCVYCLSFAPALLYIDLIDAHGKAWTNNQLLLFFLIFIVQMSDALSFIWSRFYGKRVIAPSISPNKTWEGFLGGVGTTSLLGAALWWATPFHWWQAALMSMVVAILGFAGGMVMSAIKRDRGVKDYGTLVTGHGGVLDRLDSLCFATPVFFHITKYYFTEQGASLSLF